MIHVLRIARVFAAAASGLLIVALAGCNSAHHGSQATATDAPSKGAAPSSGRDDPRIILQCAADRIQNPSAPFHWSFKKNVSDFGDSTWEADITPDSITGILADSSGSRPIHAIRSDTTGWSTAVLMLAGPLPASTFALVTNSSATERAGAEKVNGEDTVKYSIDTTCDSAADASLIKNVLGPHGFVKGSAWVTAEGCPVKFLIDVEQHTKSGTVVREHYEEAMIKK